MGVDILKGRIRSVGYGYHVLELARQFVDTDDYGISIDRERFADDLAQTLQDAIDGWFEDRDAGRSLLYKATGEK